MSEDPHAADRAPRPFLLEIEGDDEADPATVPQVPDLPPLGVTLEQWAAMAGVAPPGASLAARRRSGLGRMALWVFSALFTLVLSVSAWDFVTSLVARNAVLGSIALVLVVVGSLLALALAAREAMGFARLARLDGMRATAEAAHLAADLKAARGVGDGLVALYHKRAAAAWGVARFEERRQEVMDADALLALAEAEILGPLDALARDEIEAASRRVAMVTALVPIALADVAAALYSNLAMIRRVAEIYGGRSGALGSWRLLRRVFASLLATGAVALADDMVGSVAGGGILSKLSRRFGEGVVNGALTARIGLAAMELCRPLPFRVIERPSVSGLVSRALAGLIPRDKG